MGTPFACANNNSEDENENENTRHAVIDVADEPWPSRSATTVSPLGKRLMRCSTSSFSYSSFGVEALEAVVSSDGVILAISVDPSGQGPS